MATYCLITSFDFFFLNNNSAQHAMWGHKCSYIEENQVSTGTEMQNYDNKHSSNGKTHIVFNILILGVTARSLPPICFVLLSFENYLFKIKTTHTCWNTNTTFIESISCDYIAVDFKTAARQCCEWKTAMNSKQRFGQKICFSK